MSGPTKVAGTVVVTQATLDEAERWEAFQRHLDAAAAEAAARRAAIAAKVAAYSNPPKKPTRRERRLAARKANQ